MPLQHISFRGIVMVKILVSDLMQTPDYLQPRAT